MVLTMASKESRRRSPSAPEREEELWVLRGQLEAGQIVMTRKLMLRVVESLGSSLFGNGVNLFAYYDTDVDQDTWRRDQANEAFAHTQRGEQWCDSWYRLARPEWLDVMADILIEPPPGWMLDEEFTQLFIHVAGRFPDKAVQVLSVLFSDEKVHPRLASLIETLYATWFT